MSLMKCPECGSEISDLAENCPNCGFPIGFSSTPVTQNSNGGQVSNNPYNAPYQSQPYTQYTPKEKNSTLGILALIFSILGCTFLVGIILAIIDLVKQDGKKKTASIAALVICGVWLILGCINIATSKKDSNTYVSQVETSANQEDAKTEEANVEEVVEDSDKESGDRSKTEIIDDVKVLAEYTLPDGIGWYTRHFIIIQNNSNETVDVSTSSLAYKADGTIVSSASGEVDAVGAGCTSIMYEAFETDSSIDYYETEMNVTKSRYYESVLQDLSYVQNDINEGAVFQVTNNGSEAADFVEGYALFFSGNELVGYDDMYFIDDDSEIKPGKTISKQMTSYENFDRIEFYLTGRR